MKLWAAVPAALLLAVPTHAQEGLSAAQDRSWSVGPALAVWTGLPGYVGPESCGTSSTAFGPGVAVAWRPVRATGLLLVEGHVDLVTRRSSSGDCVYGPLPPEGERTVHEGDLGTPFVSGAASATLELPLKPGRFRARIGTGVLSGGLAPVLTRGVGWVLRGERAALAFDLDWSTVWTGGRILREEWSLDQPSTRTRIGRWSDTFELRSVRVSVSWEAGPDRSDPERTGGGR